MNQGIDYGLGQTNIDKSNGIRFGVISIHEVSQAWYDSAEIINSNCCPYCGNEPKTGNSIYGMKRCPTCRKPLEESDFYDDEPTGYKLDDGEYFATQAQDDTDIFIEKSPYYTTCQFCSPCAPGAGYIMNTVENGIKAYCFGHDFFDDGKAPYPVFSIETNEEIKPE